MWVGLGGGLGLRLAISWTATREVTFEQRLWTDTGYVGEETVAAGNVTTRTFETATGQATVVTPASLAPEVNQTGREAVLTDVAAWMPAGEPNDRTNVFVLPSEASFGAQGLAVGGGDFLVEGSLAGTGTDDRVSAGVFAHEYTHTRQRFTPGEGMAWVVEGSATSYERRHTFERQHRNVERY